MQDYMTQTHTLERNLDEGKGLARLLFLQTTSVIERYGGIEYYLDDLQTDLAQLLGGDQITTLLPVRKDSFPTPQRPFRYVPVRYRKTGFMGKIENRFSRQLWKQALAEIKKASPTHLVCGHINLAPFVYLLSLRTGIPYITCTYGIEAWGDLRWSEEFALSQSSCILTISEWTKNILRKRGYPAHQIQVVHPRLPSDFERVPRPINRRKRDQVLRLITVSRLDQAERYKGQDHVIEALHRIQMAEGTLPFEYKIVGSGTDLPRLKAMVKSYDMEEQVTFIPPVGTRAELIQLYRQADLFVMPSRFGRWNKVWRGEGFGIVYLEAAACGLPSIAYNCGGVTDIIQHKHNGWLVEPDNIAELSRTLWDLYKQPERIDILAAHAYDETMNRFTRPAIQKEILAWLRTLNSAIK